MDTRSVSSNEDIDFDDVDNIDLEDLEMMDLDLTSCEQVHNIKVQDKPEAIQDLKFFPPDVHITEEYIQHLFNSFFQSQDVQHDAFQLLINSLTAFLDSKFQGRATSGWNTHKFTSRDVAITIAENLLYAEGGRGGDIASIAEDMLNNPEFLLSATLPRLYSLKQTKNQKTPLDSMFNVNTKLPDIDEDGEITCPILCIECKPDDMVESPCGHFFSFDAFKFQAKSFEAEKSSLLKLTCMDANCGIPIPYSFTERMLDGDVKERFQQWRIIRFADMNGVFRCNAVTNYQDKCENYIRGGKFNTASLESRKEMLTEGLCEVICPDGHKRCPMCHLETHCPFPCKYMKAWTAKTLEDNASIQWKYSYTKACPRCKYDIQKDGGCAHITCYSCKYEFCWFCKKEWRNHTDWNHPDCANFDGQNPLWHVNTDAERAKYALKRFNWYETAYTDHKVASDILIEYQVFALKLVRAANFLCTPLADYDQLHPSTIHTARGREASDYMLSICQNRAANKTNNQIYHYAEAIEQLIQKCTLSDDHKERDAAYEFLGLVEESLTALKMCRSFLANSYSFRYFMDWDNPRDGDVPPKQKEEPLKRIAKDERGLPTAEFAAQDGASMQAFQCSLLNASLMQLTTMIDDRQLKFFYRHLFEPCDNEEERRIRDADAKRNSLQAFESLADYCVGIKHLVVKTKDLTDTLRTRLLDGQSLDIYNDATVDLNPDGAFEEPTKD